MPIYKDATAMNAKWVAKYNPTVVSTRFTDVADVAKSRAQTGFSWPDAARSAARPTLDAQGITGGLRATYLAFATKLYKHSKRHTGAAIANIKTGLIAYFKSAYGLSETIMTTIANAILGAS